MIYYLVCSLGLLFTFITIIVATDPSINIAAATITKEEMDSSRIVTPITSEIKGEINVKLFART